MLFPYSLKMRKNTYLPVKLFATPLPLSVSIHPKMVENLLLGVHVFINHFISLLTNFQKCLSFLEVHILKILKSMMTLAATNARRRNIPGHLALRTQKSLKMRKTTHFKPLFFQGKNFPSIMARTNVQHKYPPVNRFDFKIFYTNEKKA